MQEWADKSQAFDRHLAAHYERLISDARNRLIADVRVAAQGGETWFSDIGNSTAGNFWDEWAWAIATDSSMLELYKENMSKICNQVIERLPLFEREALERSSNEYYDMWDVDEPEPDSTEARMWLISELVDELWKQADDRGQELLNCENDDDDDEGSEPS